MRVEAVTVCVGYGDFLRETARVNRPLVDDLVVITAPDDEQTRAVCKELCLRHVLSEDYKRDGPFNKARLIQRALDQVGAQDWILHLDADIILPQRFRQYVDWAHLDEQCIYGADRCNIVGWDAWQKIRDSVGWDNYRYDSVHRFQAGAPVGNRHVPHLHGYVPIGYFQLFHGSQLIDRGFHLRRYPARHADAARTDVQFALQWDRRFRQLLPEVIVLHLESEPSPQGANWRGRTTQAFRPPPKPGPHPKPPHGGGPGPGPDPPPIHHY
jgi:hypothetical protein